MSGQVTITWRGTPLTLDFDDTNPVVDKATIPDTDIVLKYSHRDKWFWVEVEGPDCLDPMIGCWFGGTVNKATTAQEAVDNLHELLSEVSEWVTRNSGA